MSRRFLLAGMCVLGLIGDVCLSGRVVWGQNRPANAPGRAAAPAQRAANAQQAAPTQSEPLPQEVETILRDWEVESAKINTLQGDLDRWVYNEAFLRIEEATGHFWYEAPDKGRIDFNPRDIEPGTPIKVGGQPWQRHPDREEQWVSDGQQILQIRRQEKVYEQIPIPPEKRGQNIIETPLPFLFGMKAAQAKQRYDLKLGSSHDKVLEFGLGPMRVYHLIAYPKWAEDKANWQRAEIMLNPETFLPVSIKLVDPSAGPRNRQEQVYIFRDMESNKRLSLFGKFNNPFAPDLKGLQKAQFPAGNGAPAGNAAQPRAQARAQQSPQLPPGTRAMPRVINMPAKKVMETFQKSGYKIELVRGVPARDPRMNYLIYGQDPPENTPIKQGQTITLTVHDAAQQASAARP